MKTNHTIATHKERTLHNIVKAISAAILCGCLLVLMTGCGSVKVPTTEIQIGPYRYTGPKQFRADVLSITVPTTNGSITFYATNIVAENEPSVIGEQGRADALKTKAMGESFAGVVSTFGTNVLPQAIQAAGKTIVPKP